MEETSKNNDLKIVQAISLKKTLIFKIINSLNRREKKNCENSNCCILQNRS